jgi:hypothetical protein
VLIRKGASGGGDPHLLEALVEEAGVVGEDPVGIGLREESVDRRRIAHRPEAEEVALLLQRLAVLVCGPRS